MASLSAEYMSNNKDENALSETERTMIHINYTELIMMLVTKQADRNKFPIYYNREAKA